MHSRIAESVVCLHVPRVPLRTQKSITRGRNEHGRTGQGLSGGRGPGDPELLTVKAARLLGEAGVVFHDDLVPHHPRTVLQAGSRHQRWETLWPEENYPGGHPWPDDRFGAQRIGCDSVEIGRPDDFRQGWRRIDALREAGVAFEVVPGVTAASSAAAFLEASLTDRSVSSRVIVLSGHHAARTVPEPGNCGLVLCLPTQPWPSTCRVKI